MILYLLSVEKKYIKVSDGLNIIYAKLSKGSQ